MTQRPVYASMGDCSCRRPDVRLWRLPDAGPMTHPVCARCITAAGFEVPTDFKTAERVTDEECTYRKKKP